MARKFFHTQIHSTYKLILLLLLDLSHVLFSSKEVQSEGSLSRMHAHTNTVSMNVNAPFQSESGLRIGSEVNESNFPLAVELKRLRIEFRRALRSVNDQARRPRKVLRLDAMVCAPLLWPLG